METVLELNGVHANIGQYNILQGVDLSIPKGKITVLLGRNGAGKTTTLRSIMGYIRDVTGTIMLFGEPTRGYRPHQMAQRGIRYLPEDGHVFANLTVEENLRLAERKKDGKNALRLERALSLFPDLRKAWKQFAGTLSGGQKQMLSLAAVVVAEQPVLLIDEPSKGLSPTFVDRVAEVLHDLKASTTILLVEQNYYLAKLVADNFVILDDGRTVHAGHMRELLADEGLQQRFLGLQAAGGEQSP